ncbi:MAG: Stp1/IreP family PP2C-type Ser/Thr phosphatase [Clostridiales bacterium]|nr:Stp1/IreP family PP2C-type Ser/Thr phosphatase [Candidatus Crickella caballi]
MRIGYLTDRGRRRATNEDAVKVLTDKSFYMLADGVGGNKSGEVASQSALDALEKFVRHNPPELLQDKDEIFRYFRAAVNYVNQFIIKLSEVKPQYNGMATTLSFAYIMNGMMYIAHIGDSRVYLIHDGDIHQVTDDHTYVNDLVKMGVITKEEAATHSRKNVITRAIGANANNEPDCFCVPVETGDRVLLCSDGLYDELDDRTILSKMTRFDDMMICAEDLVACANDNGGNDNISVICINLVEE